METLQLGDDGDLLFTDGELTVISGEDAMLQDLRTRFLFFQNTWRFAMGFGVPFVIGVATKLIDQAQFDRAYRDVALGSPDIIEVLSADYDFNRPDRELRITMRLRSVYGVVNFEVPTAA